MIRNIVLDMGNVLLSYDPNVPLNKFCRTPEERETIRQELFLGPEWKQGDLGLMTNEEKYDSICKRVPESMRGALKRCVFEWYICLSPVSGVREFCQYAKEKGFRLYVLSNAAKDFYGYFPDFAPFDFFDGIVVSADLHMVKPDIRIYQSLLEKFHLLSEECLFIDDLEENVEGAKQAGMSGEVFRGDFDRLKKQYLEGRRIWD